MFKKVFIVAGFAAALLICAVQADAREGFLCNGNGTSLTGATVAAPSGQVESVTLAGN